MDEQTTLRDTVTAALVARGRRARAGVCAW